MTKWNVYMTERYLPSGEEERHFVGSTMAVSREKAISNVRYRIGMPHDIDEYYGDECKITRFQAVEARRERKTENTSNWILL